jgi:hypothetical protein
MNVCAWGLGGQRCYRPVDAGLPVRRQHRPIFCPVHRDELVELESDARR